MSESVTSRYDREWLQLGDNRKVRGFDGKTVERRGREFVGSNGNTVTATGDNVH